MATRRTEVWMWSEARDVLARSEEMRRQFFDLRQGSRAPTWEPPADIFETPDELVVVVALPGVDIAAAEVTIEGSDLHVVGTRRLPTELRDARVHRLELPHGRFERRIALPPGRYDGVRREAVNGCLLIRLHKKT